MKKDNKLMKFTSFVLLVVMIALILVAGTFAKYTSSATGSDTAIVAKWEILAGSETNMLDISGSNQTIDFNLFDTIKEEDGTTDELDVLADENGNVIRIAPGTSGAFDLHIENNSEVTAAYTIDFEVTGASVPLLFKVGEATEWSSSLEDVASTVLVMDNSSTTETDEGKTVVNVQWKWPFETAAADGTSTAGDAADTALGILSTEEARTVKVTAKLDVVQYDDSENANTLTLASVTNDNIGDYIDLGNNIIGTDATTDDWRILYADGTNVYAILADYLPASQVPAAAGLHTSTTDYPFGVWSDIDRDTLVNGLLNTTAWSNFTNGIAGATATGSPTAELLMSSYNTKNGTELAYTDYPRLDSSTTNYDLYVPHTSTIDDCFGYWLSSPIADHSDSVWSVFYEGLMSADQYRSGHMAARPVVTLPCDISAELVNGVWTVK